MFYNMRHNIPKSDTVRKESSEQMSAIYIQINYLHRHCTHLNAKMRVFSPCIPDMCIAMHSLIISLLMKMTSNPTPANVSIIVYLVDVCVKSIKSVRHSSALKGGSLCFILINRWVWACSGLTQSMYRLVEWSSHAPFGGTALVLNEVQRTGYSTINSIIKNISIYIALHAVHVYGFP